MGRGLERRRVLASDTDKTDFVARLSAGLAVTGVRCQAWVLMSDHYSLVSGVVGTLRSAAQLVSCLRTRAENVPTGHSASQNGRRRR